MIRVHRYIEYIHVYIFVEYSELVHTVHMCIAYRAYISAYRYVKSIYWYTQ
jgi:hypothetical protein